MTGPDVLVRSMRFVLFALAASVACKATVSNAPTDAEQWAVDPTPIFDVADSGAAGHAQFSEVVAATQLSNGTIVVGDMYGPAVMFFRPDGTLERSLSKKGSGPGEFEDIAFLGQCASDSVFVIDRSQRLSVLDAAGNVVRQGPANVNAASVNGGIATACSRDGLLAANTGIRMLPGRSGGIPKFLVSVGIMSAGGKIDTVVRDVPMDPRPLGARPVFALSRTTLFLGTGDSAFIKRFSLTGQPGGRTAIATARRPMTQQHFETAVDAQMALALPSPVEREEHKREILGGTEKPQFLPLHGALYIDSRDSAWVVTSAMGDGKTTLQALFGDGSRVITVTLPREITVFEIGDDYILGRYDDKNGAVHVVMYRMRRGPTG